MDEDDAVGLALRGVGGRDEEADVQAGGGVVHDSNPQMEFEETLHKAGALFRAAEEAVRFAGRAGRAQ